MRQATPQRPCRIGPCGQWPIATAGIDLLTVGQAALYFLAYYVFSTVQSLLLLIHTIIKNQGILPIGRTGFFASYLVRIQTQPRT